MVAEIGIFMCCLYFTSNCRYRVINKIHPCLSHTNLFLRCFHDCSGETGWFAGRWNEKQGEIGAVQRCASSEEHFCHSAPEITVHLFLRGAFVPHSLSVCQLYIIQETSPPSSARSHIKGPHTENSPRFSRFFQFSQHGLLPLPSPAVCAQGKQSVVNLKQSVNL